MKARRRWVTQGLFRAIRPRPRKPKKGVMKLGPQTDKQWEAIGRYFDALFAACGKP